MSDILKKLQPIFQDLQILMTSIIDKIYPKTQQVVDLVLKEYPMQKKNLRKAKSNLDEN